jgi:hypothetical protein
MEGLQNLLQHWLSCGAEQVAEGVSVHEEIGERIPQGLKPALMLRSLCTG